MVRRQGPPGDDRAPHEVRDVRKKLRQLCERIDEIGDPLTADLRQYYQVTIEDVFAGREDPHHVLVLAEQLKVEPNSRVRALWLGGLQFIGWDAAQYTRAAQYDLLVSVIAGLGGKAVPADVLHPKPTVQADDELKLVAPTIEDFSVATFMQRIKPKPS